jgi:hypothetical protein
MRLESKINCCLADVLPRRLPHGDWPRGLVSARQLFFWPEGYGVLLAGAEDEICASSLARKNG